MLKIESFSLLSEAPTLKIESDVFEASGHKWRLDLYPNGKEEENGGNHISLYVKICDTETLPKGWEVCVDVNFFLYDHVHHNYATFQDIVNGNRIRFHEKKMKWGFDKLISMESFKKSGNGYLVNDSCVFGAEVTAVYAQKDRCLSMIKPPEIMRTYTWKIENFLTITEKVIYSEIFRVGNVKWRLRVYPNGNKVAGVAGTNLSFYLEVHDAASLPDRWRVYAYFILRLKNQTDNDDIEKGTQKWFNSSDADWGFACFMPLKQLHDPANGFLLNGRGTMGQASPTLILLSSIVSHLDVCQTWDKHVLSCPVPSRPAYQTLPYIRRLDLYPNGNEEEKGGNHISFYVIICGTESLPKGWEVCVDINFFIYDHVHHNYVSFQDIENGNRTRFHEKKMKWGFHRMITLDSFKNCENGYLLNDSCVFGAEVFAVKEYFAQNDLCFSMTKPPPVVNAHTWRIDNFPDVTDTTRKKGISDGY
ncbi:hypothetical protein OSB04_016003 [Centaurea solstitialis]|uniref:MATH domain-containing protein n=1 Tax=Centaurea solstitialis TaxID=347529 RepID=A0AA38T7V5_9ASTR|nr:hypothetical protein OSB04_016003 [Centaurea solstitialis]